MSQVEPPRFIKHPINFQTSSQVHWNLCEKTPESRNIKSSIITNYHQLSTVLWCFSVPTKKIIWKTRMRRLESSGLLQLPALKAMGSNCSLDRAGPGWLIYVMENPFSKNWWFLGVPPWIWNPHMYVNVMFLETYSLGMSWEPTTMRWDIKTWHLGDDEDISNKTWETYRAGIGSLWFLGECLKIGIYLLNMPISEKLW